MPDAPVVVLGGGLVRELVAWSSRTGAEGALPLTTRHARAHDAAVGEGDRRVGCARRAGSRSVCVCQAGRQPDISCITIK
jgi:hypothetical protein